MSPPARPRTALQAAIGLAMGLHLALGLAWWLTPHHRAPGTAAGRPAWTVSLGTVASSARARTAPAAPAKQAALLAQAPSRPDTQSAEAFPPAVPADPPPRVVSEPNHAEADANAEAKVDVSAVASAPQTDAGPAAEAEAPYYPRPDLDVGPVPQGPVLIGFPAGMATGASHVGRLSLFIDEAGTVRKVDILATEPPLPEPMQDAARNAFLQTRFAPGQRQGSIVRSRIDIEVTFDDRPLDSMEAEAPKPLPQTAPQGPQTSGA